MFSADELNQQPGINLPGLDDEALDVLAGLDEVALNGATVRVFRHARGELKPQFVHEVAAAGFDLNEFQSEYGGGLYTLRVMLRGRYHKQVQVNIAEPPRKHSTPEVRNQPDVSQLLTTLQQGMQQQITELGKIVTQALQQKPAPDPMEAEDRAIERLARMRELFAPPSPAQTQGLDALGLIQQGIEFARSVDSEAKPAKADGLSLLLETVRSLAPAIGSALAQQQPVQRVVPVAKKHAPAQVQTALPVIHQANETESTMFNFIEQTLIKQYAKVLIEAARNGESVQMWANNLLPHLPIRMIEIFTHEELIDEIGRLVPEALQYRAWLESLRIEVLLLVNAEEELDDDVPAATATATVEPVSTAGRKAGGEANAQGNAESGPVVQDGKPRKAAGTRAGGKPA